MGSLKLEARKKIEREKESGHEIPEIGEQKIRELEEYLTFDIIEAIDDDKAAVEAARNEADDNFDIIPDETPLYIQGPGFDDCLTPGEEEYIRKKHPNIVLRDNIPQDKDDGQSFDSVRCSLESVLTFDYEKQVFQEIVDETEQNKSEMQSKLEQLAASLENLF